ncbi:MAG TPA: hypothetical protein VIE43_07445 [Thermoanaerobaculia bacterium]|nr:hypothetical protein [Thermoanaerobaculia bacterium]
MPIFLVIADEESLSNRLQILGQGTQLVRGRPIDVGQAFFNAAGGPLSPRPAWTLVRLKEVDDLNPWVTAIGERVARDGAVEVDFEEHGLSLAAVLEIARRAGVRVSVAAQFETDEEATKGGA